MKIAKQITKIVLAIFSIATFTRFHQNNNLEVLRQIIVKYLEAVVEVLRFDSIK